MADAKLSAAGCYRIVVAVLTSEWLEKKITRARLRAAISKRGKPRLTERESKELKGIVAKRQHCRHTDQTTLYKTKNPAYTQAVGRHDLFEKFNNANRPEN